MDRAASETSDPRAAVSDAYDRWSVGYDDQDNATRDLAGEVVRSCETLFSGATVLEIGCGTGKNTTWIARRAKVVVGLDFSPGMLRVAAERLSGRAGTVQLVRHDVTQSWPVADESFDVVAGSLVLEHVARLGDVFAEALRVLHPGGSLFLCELHPERQRRGGQANYVDPASRDTVYVPAVAHTVPEFVNTGIEAGLALKSLHEWYDDESPLRPADASRPPRLLSLLFRKPARP